MTMQELRREFLHAFVLRQEADVGASSKISCIVLLICLSLPYTVSSIENALSARFAASG